MRSVTFAVTVLLLSATSTCYAYETGAMSCDDIGKFAASVVEGKGNGATYKQSVTKINKLVPKGYAIERKNLKQIVRIIYKEPYGKGLSVEGAYAAMKADCEVQQ